MTTTTKGEPIKLKVMKMGKVITKNMKHIGHMPMTAQQYLRDQTAKRRMKILVTFWNTDPTNHDISYDPSTHKDEPWHIDETW